MPERVALVLDRYPHDLIPVARDMPVAPLMRALPDWTLVYEDDAFLLFVRPRLALPYADRRGQNIVRAFPWEAAAAAERRPWRTSSAKRIRMRRVSRRWRSS